MAETVDVGFDMSWDQWAEHVRREPCASLPNGPHRKRVLAMLDELEALRLQAGRATRLEPYARHAWNCRLREGGTYERACTCGLAAVLAAPTGDKCPCGQHPAEGWWVRFVCQGKRKPEPYVFDDEDVTEQAGDA